MSVKDIRRQNFSSLLELKESRIEYAKKLGYESANYINQIASGFTGIGQKLASRIEEAEGVPRGWLSEPHPELWAKAGKIPVVDPKSLDQLDVPELVDILNSVTIALKTRVGKK